MLPAIAVRVYDGKPLPDGIRATCTLVVPGGEFGALATGFRINSANRRRGATGLRARQK